MNNVEIIFLILKILLIFLIFLLVGSFSFLFYTFLKKEKIFYVEYEFNLRDDSNHPLLVFKRYITMRLKNKMLPLWLYYFSKIFHKVGRNFLQNLFVLFGLKNQFRFFVFCCIYSFFMISAYLFFCYIYFFTTDLFLYRWELNKYYEFLKFYDIFMKVRLTTHIGGWVKRNKKYLLVIKTVRGQRNRKFFKHFVKSRRYRLKVSKTSFMHTMLVHYIGLTLLGVAPYLAYYATNVGKIYYKVGAALSDRSKIVHKKSIRAQFEAFYGNIQKCTSVMGSLLLSHIACFIYLGYVMNYYGW